MDRESLSNGAADDFSDTYEEYKDAIFRHCYFHTFDRDLALDILQETFIKTWEYLAAGNTVENMRAFLYKVATNLVINAARKKKSVSLENLQESGFDPGEEDAEISRDWVGEERVMEILEKIEEPYRGAITMRYVEGLSPSEISEITGESTNVISVRIHRGLQQLKERFNHE